jgi:nucleotidyltransferase substrate binding protein (TIGR01987 family)
VDTPKNVIRELGQLEWIEDPKTWILYIDLRNEASHIYNEETANKVFSAIEQFIQDAEKLLKALETKNNP